MSKSQKQHRAIHKHASFVLLLLLSAFSLSAGLAMASEYGSPGGIYAAVSADMESSASKPEGAGTSTTATPSATSTSRCTPPKTCSAEGWRIIPDVITNSMGLNHTFADVDGTSGNDVWLVGSSAISETAPAQPMAQHWDGSKWTLASIPDPGAESSRLIALAALSEDDVWAVGYSQESQNVTSAFIQHWDGEEWSIVPISGTITGSHILRNIAATSPTDIWAVGEYGDDPQPLTVHWDGTQWSVVQGPGNASGISLYGVTAISSNDVWAVGDLSYSDADGFDRNSNATMHWDGTEWTVVPIPSFDPFYSYLSSVSASSSTNVWAAGYYLGEYGRLSGLVYRWDGSQWNEMHEAPGTQNTEIVASSASDVWVAGSNRGSLFVFPSIIHWNGQQWNSMFLPTASDWYGTIDELVAITPTDLWAIGFGNRGQWVLRYTVAFRDVHVDEPFYPYIRELNCRNIISGYADGTFRPANNVSRGQLAKIVSNSANFSDEPGKQLFEDVPPGSTFYEWIQRLARRGHISGYACGGTGEPCGTNNFPYYRPGENASRGQISKIVSNAAGLTDPVSGQTYEDVPPTGTFYEWIERLSARGVMGGYPCGGPGEPCSDANLPYFRPSSNATRGQVAKIVSNTFFSECE